MTARAVLFLLLSWTLVLGMLGWAYARILRGKQHFDPDGIGPAVPPEGGRYDRRAGRRPPPAGD